MLRHYFLGAAEAVDITHKGETATVLAYRSLGGEPAVRAPLRGEWRSYRIGPRWVGITHLGARMRLRARPIRGWEPVGATWVEIEAAPDWRFRFREPRSAPGPVAGKAS